MRERDRKKDEYRGGNEGNHRGEKEKGGENRGREKVKMCQV